jgi:hypothetical protein
MNGTEARVTTGKVVTIATLRGDVYTGKIGTRSGATFELIVGEDEAYDIGYASVESIAEAPRDGLNGTAAAQAFRELVQRADEAPQNSRGTGPSRERAELWSQVHGATSVLTVLLGLPNNTSTAELAAQLDQL